MTKLFILLAGIPLVACAGTSTRNSVGPAGGGPDARCGDCSPCDAPCPPECGDTCTLVCPDPVRGDCVVTLRRDGDACALVSCERLAPGEAPPPNARVASCDGPCAPDACR